MSSLLNKFDGRYIIDKNDIIDLIYAYIENKNLSQYLNDIDFNSKSMYSAYYNMKTNKMVFNDEKIIQSAYTFFDRLYGRYHIDEKNYTYIINYYYLYVIYHELTHVSQKAKYENDNDSLFNYLYELCFKIRKNNINIYRKHHDLFPMEKEATNKGLLIAYNLMKRIKSIDEDCNVMYNQYLFSVLDYYEKNNKCITSPIDKLSTYSSLVEIDIINKLLKETNLTKMERMNLGVNITPREYDSILAKKQKVLIHKY